MNPLRKDSNSRLVGYESTFVCANFMLQGGAEWEQKYTEGETDRES